MRLSDDQSRRGLGPESAGGIPARNTQLHNTQRRVETEKTHSSRRVVAQPLFHRRRESGQNAAAADVALQCPDGRRRTVQKPVLRLPELGLERPDGGWAGIRPGPGNGLALYPAGGGGPRGSPAGLWSWCPTSRRRRWCGHPRRGSRKSSPPRARPSWAPPPRLWSRGADVTYRFVQWSFRFFSSRFSGAFHCQQTYLCTVGNEISPGHLKTKQASDLLGIHL